MKQTIIALLIAFTLVSCGTKYNFVDTGKSNPHFKGDMYEYLESNSYDWDSVRLMINRADLRDVFRYDDITFLGLTNHSIRKWLIPGGTGHDTFGYTRIDDIPVERCRAIVLSMVLEGKMLREEIERVEYDEKKNRVGGGRKLTSRLGNRIWLWTTQSPWMGVEGMGPIVLNMSALRSDNKTEFSTSQIASSDIQPTNGVVHALPYSYNLDDIGSLSEFE